eukprot:scaffold101009_cov63-Phaeocystis_antarctica.AAC.7
MVPHPTGRPSHVPARQCSGPPKRTLRLAETSSDSHSNTDEQLRSSKRTGERNATRSPGCSATPDPFIGPGSRVISVSRPG